jgi:hypothetical protein
MTIRMKETVDKAAIAKSKIVISINTYNKYT